MNEKTVLVVDDEPGICEMVAEFFGKMHGFDCLRAENGVEALRLIGKHPKGRGGDISFIFSDIEMPEMDGIALVGEIVKLKKDIPVVLMSGSMNIDDFNFSWFKKKFPILQDLWLKPVSLWKFRDAVTSASM